MSAINSLNINSGRLYSISTNQLSEETKAKLIALGIDPSSVSSEAEAQALISQVEAMSKTDKARPKTNNLPTTPSSEQELMTKARELAEKVGVQLSQTDTLDDMCKKISEKLEKLAGNYASDTPKMNVIKGYSEELAQIDAGYQKIQNNHQSIFAAMNMLSMSNKFALGLNG